MINDLFEFGPFRLEIRDRLLWKGDEAVALRSREFDTLNSLARRTGDPVDRAVLIQEIWGDTNITDGDNNLSKQIGALRKKLGVDESGQDYIQTVPGRGYLLRARVAAARRGEPTKDVDPITVPAPPSKPPRNRTATLVSLGAVSVLLVAAVVSWSRVPSPGARMSHSSLALSRFVR